MSAADETGDPVSENDTPATESEQPQRPVLRIVGGNPTDEEVAVLVAVLGSAGGSDDSGPAEPRDLWGTPTDRLRPPLPLSPSTFLNLRFGY